jgi:hypothetical protein
MTDLASRTTPADLLERVVVGGDLSKLTAPERLGYYRAVCESVGLNPFTRPFDYLTLNGRLVLYAKRDATDQLRAIHGVSVYRMEKERFDDLFVVTAYAKNKEGREDSSTGAVSIAHLKGEALANAIMKAETKAKRRVTLSLCGLGLLDETEVGSVAGALTGGVDVETGEILEGSAAPATTADDSARASLLARIEKGAAQLGLTAAQLVGLSEDVCGIADYTKAEGADLKKLLDKLTALYREAQPKKG